MNSLLTELVYNTIATQNFKITPDVLRYKKDLENGPVAEAIDKIKRDHNIEIKISEGTSNYPMGDYKPLDEPVHLSYPHAKLLVLVLGKILGRDLSLPDSQQDELALHQMIVRYQEEWLESQNNVDDMLTWSPSREPVRWWSIWRDDLIAYGQSNPVTMELLKKINTKADDFPLIIRHPSIVIDKNAESGFTYILDDHTRIIKNAYFLRSRGQRVKDFEWFDPGLFEIGFPYYSWGLKSELWGKRKKRLSSSTKILINKFKPKFDRKFDFYSDEDIDQRRRIFTQNNTYALSPVMRKSHGHLEYWWDNYDIYIDYSYDNILCDFGLEKIENTLELRTKNWHLSLDAAIHVVEL